MLILRSAPLLLLSTLALGACGAGVEVIERADLEKQVRTKMTEFGGQQAPKASCPDELLAKAGETTRCHMDFPDNKRLGITVKVKSAKDGTAKFEITADETAGETPG